MCRMQFVFIAFLNNSRSRVDSIQFMWVKIRPCGEELIVCMEVESEANLSSFFDKAEKGECEDGVWKFTFTVKKAGEK